MASLLESDCAIRQLHARYSDAVWRKDYAAFGDCFAEDAEWRISGLTLRGRAEIVSALEKLLPRFARVLVTLRTPIIDVADGIVSARTYLSEQSVFADGRPYGPIGIYYERFVTQGDRWRFSWRLFQTHYTGPPDMTGKFFENPDYGAPPAMPPLDAPTINHSSIELSKL